MALTSARFRGNSIFERIHHADTSVYLRINSQGEEVREVQNALLDLGYSIPEGATAFLGSQTADAVSQFKRDHNLVPSDPVVGTGTITTLDTLFAMPFADRDEFLSWATRALPQWNFTRRNELHRRTAGLPFTFNPVSNWVPQAIKDGIVTGLTSLLDPAGSPNGVFSPAATWGASPLDLFHCHVVVDLGGMDPRWSDVQTLGNKVDARSMQLRRQANAVGPEEGPVWTAAFAALIFAPALPGEKSFIDLCREAIEAAVATSIAVNQPLKIVWHTFESPPWRPVDMASDDPRRGWWNTVAPVAGPVTSTPFQVHQFGSHVFHLMELAFLVDQAGVITVMAQTIFEAGAVVGLDKSTINTFF
jgi:hypothetical protein